MTKYPDVEVQLSGEDGNAFIIIGRVQAALESGGATQGELDQFATEAKSGDYDALLRTVMRWVAVR